MDDWTDGIKWEEIFTMERTHIVPHDEWQQMSFQWFDTDINAHSHCQVCIF